MKKILLIINVLFLSLLSFAADDQPEKAGDNLDLDAVLNLFEKSESVEDFENQLNSEKNDVNNLDLNEDGFVDYIRVIDYSDGNTHSLTLQVPYSDEEAQDVARLTVPVTSGNSLESFSMAFEASKNGVDLHLGWGTARIAIPFTK